MDKEQIEEIFDEAASRSLNCKLAYKMWLKGVWDEEDAEDIGAFLSAYSFDGERELYADELIYYYRIFKYIGLKNDLSFFSW